MILPKIAKVWQNLENRDAKIVSFVVYHPLTRGGGKRHESPLMLLRKLENSAALGPFPPVSVGDGVSAIRCADVEGNHQWVGGYERDGFS